MSFLTLKGVKSILYYQDLDIRNKVLSFEKSHYLRNNSRSEINVS